MFVPVYVAKDILLQAAEVQQEAALLLGRLSLSEACKGAIRGHFGIVTLLRMLDRPGLDRSSKEVVVRTLSILAVDNEVNQDHIRCAVAEAMHCLFTLCCVWFSTMHVANSQCRVHSNQSNDAHMTLRCC